MSKQSLESLFKELDNFIQESEFDAALGICDKILKIDPNDNEAFHCKLICFIQNNKFEEAISLLKENPKQAPKFAFEQAYAFYRLKQYKDALQILTSVQQKSLKHLELEAQVYYRLEDSNRAIALYEQILKEKATLEVKTNLLAAYILGDQIAKAEQFILSNKSSLKENFEFAYNAGCVALEAGDLETAESYLTLSEKTCREYLKEEGASESEINEEVSIILVQLGYVKQMQRKSEQALELYNSVLKNKPSDEIAAIASNNVVSVKQDHDLFHSIKKVQQASSTTLDQKLSSTQKRMIGFNHCLVLLHMNKMDQCRELLKTLTDQFPESEELGLISAAIHYKEKKLQKCEEILRNFVEKNPKENMRARLSLAQVQLNASNVKQTIEILASTPSLHSKPALVASLVQLYTQMEETDLAIKTLDQFLTNFESQKQRNDEEYVKILKYAAQVKLENKKYSEAANLYEKIMKIASNDIEVLPAFIIAISQRDPTVAEKYAMKLPPLAGEQEIDAEQLENLSTPQTALQRAEKEEKKAEAVKVEKKKKKKKQIRYPKNFDPKNPGTLPDPERWLPLRERSYAKKRVKKGKQQDQFKGPQGALPDPKDKEKQKAPLSPEPQKAANSPAKSAPSSSQQQKKAQSKKRR